MARLVVISVHRWRCIFKKKKKKILLNYSNPIDNCVHAFQQQIPRESVLNGLLNGARSYTPRPQMALWCSGRSRDFEVARKYRGNWCRSLSHDARNFKKKKQCKRLVGRKKWGLRSSLHTEGACPAAAHCHHLCNVIIFSRHFLNKQLGTENFLKV